LPTLNVEDTDRDDGRDGSGHGSRRPSKLTLDSADEVVEPATVKNIAELATTALRQLEPEVTDTQLAEVRVKLFNLLIA